MENDEDKGMGEREIVLKVKYDSYKAISNYLKNELGISKKQVEEIISRQTEEAVSKYLQSTQGSKTLDTILSNEVSKILANAFGVSRKEGRKGFGFSYDSPSEEMKKYVTRVFDDTIKNFSYEMVKEQFKLVPKGDKSE